MSVLELREENAGYIARYASAGEYTTVGEFNLRLHTVLLNHLEPETTYEYRIGEDMPWIKFRTASADASCRAIVFPDSQSDDGYVTWGRVYSSALARHEGVDFTAHLGDLVDQGTNTKQWFEWFAHASEGLKTLPAAPVMGSHETYHSYNGKIEVVYPDIFLHAFPVPWNRSRAFSRWYYSFDCGPVHFIVLNTEFVRTDAIPQGLFQEMSAWFLDSARYTEKPWTVVMMHRDILNARPGPISRQEFFAPVARRVMPLIEQGGVDLVLAGDIQVYARHGRIRQFRRSEDGPLYVCGGVSGSIRYPVDTVNPFNEKKVSMPDSNNYLLLEADRENLSLTSYYSDGRQMDRVEMRPRRKSLPQSEGTSP